MLILGIVLIIVGACVVYFFRPERLLMFVGAVLLLVGLLLVLLGVFDTADVNVSDDGEALRSSWGVMRVFLIR